MASSPDRTSMSSNTDVEKHDDLTPEPSVIVEEKSRGVVQIERFRERIDTKYRIALYGSFTVLAYIMSLGKLSLLSGRCDSPLTFSFPSVCSLFVTSLLPHRLLLEPSPRSPWLARQRE